MRIALLAVGIPISSSSVQHQSALQPVLVELLEIEGGADQRPLGPDILHTPNSPASKTHVLLDLAKDRFHNPLSGPHYLLLSN